MIWRFNAKTLISSMFELQLMRRPIYVWQPASLFQPESNNAAFTKYMGLVVGVSKQKSIVPKQRWLTPVFIFKLYFSDSCSLCSLISNENSVHPLKMRISQRCRFKQSNIKKHFSRETPPATDVLFYCTSNGMALRRCKAWCTAGLWIRQCEVRMTLYSDFKLTFKPVSTILKYFSMLKNKGGTTWGLFVKEINCTLL